MSDILISCGGTGGHLAPGIALAERLLARGHMSHLLISNKDVDSKLIVGYPQLSFIRAPGAGFSLKPLKFLRFIFQQFRSVVFTLRLVRRFNPDVVVGFGGFMTVGLSLASYISGCPVVLHEANRMPGRAIRLLSGLAKRVYLPEGVHLRSIPPKTMRHAGYPVRQEICKIPQDIARKKMGIKVSGKLLLVLGGSQGASALNEWAEAHFEELAKHDVSILCIAGIHKKSASEVVHRSPSGVLSSLYIWPFSTQMAEILSTADLVVSRAGAGSIAEFIRCRLPAVLVPYPSSTNNHQMVNAHFFEQQGGGVLLNQDNLDKLQDEVLDLINNDWLLQKFSSNLERLDRNNSIDHIVKDLETIFTKE